MRGIFKGDCSVLYSMEIWMSGVNKFLARAFNFEHFNFVLFWKTYKRNTFKALQTLNFSPNLDEANNSNRSRTNNLTLFNKVGNFSRSEFRNSNRAATIQPLTAWKTRTSATSHITSRQCELNAPEHVSFAVKRTTLILMKACAETWIRSELFKVKNEKWYLPGSF